MRLTSRFLFLPALAVACLLVAQVAQAQHRITYFQGADTATAEPGDANNGDGEVLVDAIPTISGITDLSGLGSEGSWFFNFDQATNSGSAPEFGEVDDLPSWITVDKVSAPAPAAPYPTVPNLTPRREDRQVGARSRCRPLRAARPAFPERSSLPLPPVIRPMYLKTCSSRG